MQGVKISEGEITDFRKYKWQALFAPVDIASLVFFRILFGSIMLWEVYRYFSNGWIARYWIRPKFHFTYWPFDWLEPLPGNGMYILFAILGLLAFLIIIGLFYRIATILFFLGFTYSFLLEQTRYLNHFYLVILISFVLIFIPTNRWLSVDSKLSPKISSDVIPAWSLWLLRFTIGLPYFFGGIAKINGDWLRGEPLRSWLSTETDFPIIGQFFTEDWMVYLISYSGLLMDLLMVPLLLFKRTRTWAFLIAIIFNLFNARLFQIGIFPWFMLAATTIYFNPSWPRRLLSALRPSMSRNPVVTGYSWTQTAQLNKKQSLVVTLVFAWFLLHITLPLRHFLIPGDVHWTEVGHKYSWHMKLRSKRGDAYFVVKDKQTGEETIIKSRKYLTSWQERKMSGWPNLVWQFSKKLKEEYRKKGKDVEVFAHVMASLNGRDYQLLVDPNIDLSSAPRPMMKAPDWIIPLKEELRVGRLSEGEED